MKCTSVSRIFLAVLLFTLVLVNVPTADAANLESEEFTTSSFAGAAEAAALTSDALREAKNILRRTYSEDVTQAQVSHLLETMMRAEGADAGLSFPTLTMSGPELEEPHGDSTDDETHYIRPAYEPAVMIDIGCKYLSHCSDVTRTFFFESATQEMYDAYEAVLATELAIIEAVAPGVLVTDLDTIHDTSLSAYAGVEGISLLNIWGHGVGRYVHEYPMLYGGSIDVVLEEGDVLAIEPGIYSEDGWAVRIEDSVLVTSTGYEVLSNAPKLLTDVMINTTIPKVSVEISLGEYEYNEETSVNVDVSDTGSRDIDSVYHFDGYRWNEMNLEVGTQFERTYMLNYSYSSSIECMLRVHIGNESHYFLYHVETQAEATSRIELGHPIVVESGTLDPPTFWSIEEPGVTMIRFKFEEFSGPEFDQMLVMDSNHRVFTDLMGEGAKHRWTPWIAGEEIELQVVPTENPLFGGVGDFSLNISMYEVLVYTPPVIEPPTSTTSITTEPSPSITTATNSTGTDDSFNLDDVQIMMIGFTSGIVTLVVVGFLVLRRTEN